MTNVETAQLLWKEFEYRHQLFWKLFFRSVVAVLALSSAPFLSLDQLKHPEQIERLNQFISIPRLLLFFPLAALLVSCAATYVLKAELHQVRVVIRTFKELLASELRIDFAKTYQTRARGPGSAVIWSFFGISALLALGEMAVLWSWPT